METEEEIKWRERGICLFEQGYTIGEAASYFINELEKEENKQWKKKN